MGDDMISNPNNPDWYPFVDKKEIYVFETIFQSILQDAGLKDQEEIKEEKEEEEEEVEEGEEEEEEVDQEGGEEEEKQSPSKEEEKQHPSEEDSKDNTQDNKDTVEDKKEESGEAEGEQNTEEKDPTDKQPQGDEDVEMEPEDEGEDNEEEKVFILQLIKSRIHLCSETRRGKLIEIKQPYVVVRPNLGRSPYEAEFDPKLYSRIYDEGWAACQR